MIVGDVMDQIGKRLNTMPQLNVQDYDADSVEVPAALIGLPGDLDFLGTYSNGLHSIMLEITILVSRADDRISRDEIAPYGDGRDNPQSVLSILETGEYSAFDFCQVQSGRFQVVSIEEIEYLTAIFVVKIFGSGR